VRVTCLKMFCLNLLNIPPTKMMKIMKWISRLSAANDSIDLNMQVLYMIAKLGCLGKFQVTNRHGESRYVSGNLDFALQFGCQKSNTSHAITLIYFQKLYILNKTWDSKFFNKIWKSHSKWNIVLINNQISKMFNFHRKYKTWLGFDSKIQYLNV